MTAKILVAEDDESLTSFLQPMLKRAGFQVVIARDGEEALALAAAEEPDLVVLDVRMPKLDGWGVCRELRKQERYIPIIMLTVLSETVEKVKGLSIGADHYLTKPFDPHELIAQIEATLRTVRESRESPRPHRLVFDRLEIDLEKRKVWAGRQEVQLTPTEFNLLRFLAEQPGQVFGRETLLDRVWGWDVAVDSRAVDKNIAELRRKLEPNPSAPQYILTVRGVGYQFRERCCSNGDDQR
ncbi:MAG: response regulator transcription factor [Anaerolineales bacterium]|nr:response regulator transcription factor [Anaerolineales bacterium]